MSRRFLTYLMALATVTLWGASFPLTKVALEALGPTSLAFLRWTVSAVVLMAWLWWGERNRNRVSVPVTSATAAKHPERSEAKSKGQSVHPGKAASFDCGLSPSAQDAEPLLRLDATYGTGRTKVNENTYRTRAFRRFLPSRGRPAKASSPDSRAAVFSADPPAAANATGNRSATPAELRYRATTGARIRSLLRGDWFPVLWVSLSGITLFYWLENTALRFTTATNAGVLSNLTSVFMVLIAVAFLRERLGWLEWLAMAVAFGGAVLVSQGAGHLTLSGDGWIGDLMMVVASLFAAIYSIGGKRLSEKYSAAVVITVVAAVGAAFLLPLALIEGLHLNLSLRVWGVVLLLGVGSGALANAWWLVILARMDASRAALALFLIPVIAASLSVLLLGEPLTPTIVLGGILVLGGVMAVQRKVADEM